MVFQYHHCCYLFVFFTSGLRVCGYPGCSKPWYIWSWRATHAAETWALKWSERHEEWECPPTRSHKRKSSALLTVCARWGTEWQHTTYKSVQVRGALFRNNPPTQTMQPGTINQATLLKTPLVGGLQNITHQVTWLVGVHCTAHKSLCQGLHSQPNSLARKRVRQRQDGLCRYIQLKLWLGTLYIM